jgi:hypothetical protein
MAATFQWAETNGAVSPPAGETVGRTDCNWKNIDDSTTAYSSSPITAGNNGYDKFSYGKFTSSWNQITNCKYGVSATSVGANTTLTGAKTMAAAADRVSYRTPVKTATATNSTTFATTSVDRTLYLSKTSPDDAGCTTSISAGGTGYTCYMYTFLATTGSAAAGDTSQVTFTLQYDEN